MLPSPLKPCRLKLFASITLCLATLSPSAFANTPVPVPNGTTDLTTLGATTTSDLEFTNITYAPAAFTANSALSIGTLDDLDNSQTLSISGTGAITLNGGANSVAPSAADLFYVIGGGTLNISNNIALTTAAASGNFDIAGASTLSGTISDGGTGFGFTKTGGGTLTLSGPNTYSGGTVNSAGTIVLGSSSALGTGSYTVSTGNTATTDLNGQTLGNALLSGGNGAIITNSSGTVANVTTGFNATGAGGFVISDFTVNGTGNINWSGSIRRTNGGGEVTKSGTNTLTLSGAGTGYTNLAYIVTGGTLAFNMPTGSVFNQFSGFGSINGIQDGANVAGAEGTGVTNTIAAVISNNGGSAGTFTQSGAGTTILTATNTYTGATTINSGGTLQLDNNGTTGALSPSSAITDNGTFIISRSNTATQGTDFSTAAITGSGTVTKISGGTTVFNAANTYAGGTTISGGTVQLGSSTVGTAGTVGSNGALTSGPLGTGSVTIITNASTLDLNGQTFGNRFTNAANFSFITNTSATAATVSGAMDGSLTGNVISDFSIGGNAGDITWTGKISRTNGTFGLTKTGNDTVNFTGTTSNTGIGTLTINAGVVGLGMAAPATAFSDSVTVAGGTLKFRPDLGVATGGGGFSGQINSNLQLNSGTVDLFGSSGINSRLQQFYGTGGTLTNTSATAGVLGVAARNSSAYTFAGTVQDSTGTVGIDFTASGTSGSGRINIFSGTNTYSGTTSISYGTYELGNALASQNSTLIVNAANGLGTNSTYSLTTTNPLAFANGIGTFTIGGLSGAGNIALTDIGRTATGTTATAASVNLRVGSNLAINAAPAAYSGVISDGTVAGGSLTKIGTSTLILSGTNTYTGGTTVNGGVLQLNVGGASGTLTGALTINSGGTVKSTTGDSLGYSGGNGTTTLVNVNAGGTFDNGVAANQGYVTSFVLTGGSVTSSGGGSINFNPTTTNSVTSPALSSLASPTTALFSAPITLRSGTALPITVASGTTTSGIDLNISGAIGQNGVTGAIDKEGAGTLQLSGTNTYSGATTDGAGTLILSGNNNARTGTTTVAAAAVLQLQANAANTTSGVSTAFSGTSGSLAVNGGSTIQLRGDSSVSFSGTNFSGLGGNTLNFDVNQLTAAGTGNTLTVASGGIATGGGFGSTNTINVTGGNGYTLGLGSINVNNVESVILNPTTANLYISALTNSTNVITKNGAGTATLGSTTTNQTGSLTVNAGTLVLAGSNNYTGTTSVSGGILLVNGSTSTGNVTVASGATFGGGGSAAGTATINGTVAPGTAAATIGMLTLSSTGGATIGASGIYLADINSSTSDNLKLSAGALTITGGAALTFNQLGTPSASSYDLANYTSETGTFTVTNLPSGYTLSYGATELDLVATAVPEPSTWAAGLLCLGAFGVRLRRRVGGLFMARRAG